MPRKKFNREQADKFWSDYTKNLSESIGESEKEGLEKGYSSYQIERLWQEKTAQRVQRKASTEKEGNKSTN